MDGCIMTHVGLLKVIYKLDGPYITDYIGRDVIRGDYYIVYSVPDNDDNDYNLITTFYAPIPEYMAEQRYVTSENVESIIWVPPLGWGLLIIHKRHDETDAFTFKLRGDISVFAQDDDGDDDYEGIDFD